MWAVTRRTTTAPSQAWKPLPLRALSTPLFTTPSAAQNSFRLPTSILSDIPTICRTYSTGRPFKPVRTSSQFTFSTRFPRKQKPGAHGGKGGKKGSKPKAKYAKIPGLILPSRLSLANFKPPPGTKPKTRRERRQAIDAAKPADGSSSSSAPAAPRRTAGGGERRRPNTITRASKSAVSRAAHEKKFKLDETDFVAPLTQSHETLQELHQRVRQTRFENVGLCEEVVQAVRKGLGLSRPTEVQSLCIPKAVANPQSAILCAAETGSGKTLAYLLPIFHHLRMEEKAEPAPSTTSDTPQSEIDLLTSLLPDGTSITSTSALPTLRKLNQPRALIIVPTRDLVTQVHHIAKSLSHHARLRIAGFHARSDKSTITRALSSPIDLLITTPSTLVKHLTSPRNRISLKGVKHIVVDEADTLFDEENSEEISKILAKLEHNPHPYSALYTTATLPRTLTSHLRTHHPTNLHRITTPTLHRTLPKLHQSFLRVENGTQKKNLLIDVLKRAVQEDERIVVFVNRRQTGEDVAGWLREKGFLSVDLSSKVDVRERAEVLRLFTEGKVPMKVPKKEGEEEGKGKKDAGVAVGKISELYEKAGKGGEAGGDATTTTTTATRPPPVILVSTDIASRGIDTTSVGHVILYDFPQTAIDYLHRVGRTARNGQRGRATSIITRKDQQLAEFIEAKVRRREVLA
ncbi:hypothetical protein HK097_010166 [Rhizophlyctis rosea]|uniref:P-loop containing nucleoside triphosphate hydrolase protein n=1 Tax=Rhizophlyctis rosea TaxID=64517 RepID=A0AAD5S7Z1_9FUNG|nr:hypothetical protein HK097_010166 [Rhizophlyctis rosea]